MITKTYVKNYLQQLAVDEGITIIYAILGGSRAFNNFLDVSDWDIYFVFDGNQNYIKRHENIDGNSVTFKGYKREIYVEFVQKGASFYMIDGLRCSEIYYDTENFHNKLLSSIDYDMDEGGRTVFEGIIYRIKRHIKHNYTCVVLAGTNVSTKKYRIALYMYIRLLWINANNSVLYPLDRNILLQDFVNEDWYTDAVNIFLITDKFTSRNTAIDKILEQVNI